MGDDDQELDELVDFYGGRDEVEEAMRSAAMQAINALKATEQLSRALRDVLADWSRMSPGDAARTLVERRALGHRLEEIGRELGKLKIDVRELQGVGRRDPIVVPDTWRESRDWYRIVQTI